VQLEQCRPDRGKFSCFTNNATEPSIDPQLIKIGRTSCGLAERARDVARLFTARALRVNRDPAGREPLVRSVLREAVVTSTTLTFTRESMLLEAPVWVTLK